MRDGVIRLSGERFEATEILFQPELIQKEQKGISEMVFDVIQSADIDLRANLYAHIIISGGTSMTKGFSHRLQSDLNELYEKRILKGSTSKKVQTEIILQN
jgi:actin-related protein 2